MSLLGDSKSLIEKISFRYEYKIDGNILCDFHFKYLLIQ